MEIRKLSAAEFEATAIEPMQDVTRVAGAAVNLDVWPYTEAVLAHEYSDRDTDKWDVERVYRNADNSFQHILIPTHRRKEFLVIVVDVEARDVLGYYLLAPDEQPDGVLEA